MTALNVHVLRSATACAHGFWLARSRSGEGSIRRRTWPRSVASRSALTVSNLCRTCMPLAHCLLLLVAGSSQWRWWCAPQERGVHRGIGVGEEGTGDRAGGEAAQGARRPGGGRGGGGGGGAAAGCAPTVHAVHYMVHSPVHITVGAAGLCTVYCTVLRNMQCRCLRSHRSLEVPHQTRRRLRQWTTFAELQAGYSGM